METLTKKIKIKPTKQQKIVLWTLSNEHRLLYNHLLSFARDLWFSGQGCDFKLINEQYKLFREQNNLTIPSKSAQNTSRMLINDLKSFYALRKDKINNAKFPKKFKSWKKFSTFQYDYNNGNGGFKIKDNIIYFTLVKYGKLLEFKLPDFCIDINENNILTVLLFKENKNFYISITYNKETNNLQDNKNYMSIDLGTSNIATCYSNKINNLQIQNTKFINLEYQIEKIQSKMDKKKKYSKRYNKIKFLLNKKHKKLSNKNKDFQHKVSRKIINLCLDNDINTLVVGDIQTKKCINEYRHIRNKNNQGRGTLSRFKGFLKYKSSISGLNFHLVNEAYTSQYNCLTGKKEFDSSLHIREDEVVPGIFIDRDLNGAINIFKKFKQEFKAAWLDQFQDFNLDKMYMNQFSELCMISSI